ncbi:hypothetical protein ACFQL8_30705 [Streptomyces goshikiensis]|uniref:hypothetical protein n=1 Tax=Streptomyces goshikiensis TaxID=1942 RepID=UPI001671C96F|nr:hypothetical protein [Streptomyces goshikiensis]GHD83266.1 hypothetical protein GCM10010336_74410 [Streptomyces goshikiensis]
MELSTLLAVAVPSATLLGGLGGAFVNGTATRRASARTAEIASRATHAKEQLEALAAYLDAVRDNPRRPTDTAHYYRAALLAPTKAIDDAVERIHDARTAYMEIPLEPRPGFEERSQLRRWAAAERADEEAGRPCGFEYREALDAVYEFNQLQKEARSNNKPEKDREPLATYLTERGVTPDIGWARRLVPTWEEQDRWEAEEAARRLLRQRASGEVSLAVRELDDLVRAWVRGQR